MAARSPQAVACNVCGSTDSRVAYRAGEAQRNQIVTCTSCGLMFASPREYLVDHEMYDEADATGVLRGVEDDRTHEYRWRYDKEVGQTRDYDRARARLNELHPDRGRLLEIGCSMGMLLRKFQEDGWDVTGVDPWKEAALYASEHGIPCHGSTLEAAALPSESFDVVVMLHVIEHVPDPAGTLAEIERVLRPGGHLLLETPRYDTLVHRLAGRRERSLSCDGHIYFFTTETLGDLYGRVGFEEVMTEHNGRTLSGARLLWNVGVMAKRERVAAALDRVSQRLRLDRVRLHVNLRDMQRVLLRKPDRPGRPQR